MNIVAMMRVKNEARWIRRSIESILPICSRVLVFDDHSTDDTPYLAEACGAEVHASPFEGLDEVRDKNYLLDRAMIGFPSPPDWVIMIDGDEALEDYNFVRLASALQTSKARALACPVLYLWDREDQVRCDGVYGSTSRVSAFRPGTERFEATGGANFHCGNAPQGIKGRELVQAPLLHFGYLDRADRIRKYEWYNANDPGNEAEDRYRHIVQGDVAEVPASAKLKHAGPLKFRPL
jgi:glycosyltransferase involved in cell wall biosynthesis